MAEPIDRTLLPSALEQTRQSLQSSGEDSVKSRARNSILIVGPTPPPRNGMTRATELILAALADDFSISHLDTADRRGLANIGRFELGNLFLAAKYGFTFFRLAITNWPHIVYVPISQSWLPFLRDCLFLVPAIILNRKIIVHLHGGYFGRFYRESSSAMRWIVRHALGTASLAIVLGQPISDAFDGIVPRDRIRVIPNGIPDHFGNSVPEHPIGRPPLLLFLSTLTTEKGVLDLLRALHRVRQRTGNVRAVFAGEWYSQRDEEAARDIIQSLSLGDAVEFVGPVGPDEKRRLLENADVFVFPTKYRFEGHPFVILEAMSAGLPVISTNVACIPDTIRDGIDGLLVAPGDISALAYSITQILENEALRRRLGQAARARFLAEYTYDKFEERIKTVFAEVLQAGYELRTPDRRGQQPQATNALRLAEKEHEKT